LGQFELTFIGHIEGVNDLVLALAGIHRRGIPETIVGLDVPASQRAVLELQVRSASGQIEGERRLAFLWWN
jgi:hypothetical protein